MPNPFLQFLTNTQGIKEVSLAMPKDALELSDWKDTLIKEGYTQITDLVAEAKELESKDKVFFILDILHPKHSYDLVCQYPTGQVELFDHEASQPVVVNPKPEQTVVMLANAALWPELNPNFDFLTKVGPVYRP